MLPFHFDRWSVPALQQRKWLGVGTQQRVSVLLCLKYTALITEMKEVKESLFLGLIHSLRFRCHLQREHMNYLVQSPSSASVQSIQYHVNNSLF